MLYNFKLLNEYSPTKLTNPSKNKLEKYVGPLAHRCIGKPILKISLSCFNGQTFQNF